MRIQILELPSEVVGDVANTPFAIVVDQHPVDAGDQDVRDGWSFFKAECGAKALMVTPETIEIVR